MASQIFSWKLDGKETFSFILTSIFINHNVLKDRVYGKRYKKS
jgi:hypothetical protein